MEDLMQSILVIYIFASNIQNINQKHCLHLREPTKMPIVILLTIMLKLFLLKESCSNFSRVKYFLKTKYTSNQGKILEILNKFKCPNLVLLDMTHPQKTGVLCFLKSHFFKLFSRKT